MKKALLINESGSVIIVMIAVLFMMTIVALSMFSISSDDMTISSNSQNLTKAFYSAESGLAIARSVLWTDYINWASTNPQKLPGKVGNRDTYISYLDNIGLADSTQIAITNSLDLGDGQYIDSVTVQRKDEIGTTILTVSSSGSSIDNSRHTIRSILKVEGAPFKGFEFAILSNNVNCIMCHTTIDNVNRVYNFDTTKTGTFDRVKVASLESMLIRTTSADSYIAGTIYTRGIVTDKSGNIITNLSPTGSGVEGYDISSTDGKIQEPLNSVNLTNTTGSPLPQYGNLYLNYPSDPVDMTDGELPSEFPPPFPDDNNNRLVDDEEFKQVASNSTGSITGGIIYGVKASQTYTDANLPGSGNESSVFQSYNGNLILVGTEAEPLVLNGNIAVDGDVVIQGVVKGTGQITARGNVYITGDLTYDDGEVSGNRTFGTAPDGTRNALSVASGGNILVGDYLTTKDGNIDPGNQENGETFSFTMSEITLFNRREWTKTQQFLPDENGNMVANATYEPAYQPRYYTLNDGDPVYIYNKMDISDGKGTYWDPSTNSWMGKEHISDYDMGKLTKLDAGAPELVSATVQSLSSTSSWISSANLNGLWAEDESNRTSGEEFKIDGQLYTNNSIFALTRSSSNTEGKMTVNGALVASDVGVLVPVKLNLHYDQRLKTFMKIKDESQVVMSQVAWYSE